MLECCFIRRYFRWIAYVMGGRVGMDDTQDGLIPGAPEKDTAGTSWDLLISRIIVSWLKEQCVSHQIITAVAAISQSKQQPATCGQ